jgi:hypothetical protein
MPKRETAIIASADLLKGDKLYLQRARIALPYLVRQAKAGKPIYYSDLANEIGIPNPRNLNFILGSIGKTLRILGEKWRKEIPKIQTLVVNKKTGMPGEGFYLFLPNRDFKKLTKSHSEKIVKEQLLQIFTYPDWDWVLEQLNLKPIASDFKELVDIAGRLGGGESERHKKFKDWISKNPKALGLEKELTPGIIEYKLPSGDLVDVVFKTKTLIIGVEVKSAISNEADLLRGLFQCVKYKHVIEAKQVIENQDPDCRVILALEGKFPHDLLLAKNLLSIEVVDNLQRLKKIFY